MKSSDTQMELVRRYLGGEATLEEAQRLEAMLAVDAQLRRDYLAYARVEAGLSSKVRPKLVKTAPPTRWLSWRPLAAAAGLMLTALIGGLVFSSLTQASAAAVVQRALKAHTALLDRCYRVEVRGAARAGVPRSQESLLWTRGDRFWNQIEADGKSVAWGRDEAGGVWFALSRKEGARLAANEVPEALAQACELRSLEMESLLQTILADFDLRRDPASSGADVIHAELKAGSVSKYRSALLEADAESGVLRRVELHREHQGRVVAVISAALVESSLQDVAGYTLEGHLDADAAIYERESGRVRRAALIADFLTLVRVRLLP